MLYEGYVLWPYRRSAAKNAKRWTFGGVFPPRHNAAHPDDRAAIQAQCLVEGDDARSTSASGSSTSSGATCSTPAGCASTSWSPPARACWRGTRRPSASSGRGAIEIPAGTDVEPLAGGARRVVRSWRGARGRRRGRDGGAARGLSRVTVRVENTTPWPGGDRDDALRSTLLDARRPPRRRGAFVSLTDPPAELADAAAACVNDGVWPVLVGAAASATRCSRRRSSSRTTLGSRPRAPATSSTAGEIDRLLILNMLSLTPDEQDEMRASDPRTREILERCRGLGPDELLPLHGVIREFGAIRDFRPSVS